MSVNNQAHTVLPVSAGLDIDIGSSLNRINTDDILLSNANLDVAASISTGNINVSAYSSIQINLLADQLGTLTYNEFDFAGQNIKSTVCNNIINRAFSIRIPVETVSINVTHLNGGVQTTAFSISVRGKANSDDSVNHIAVAEFARTTTPLGIAGTYTSGFFPTDGFARIRVNAVADKAGTIYVIYSNDVLLPSFVQATSAVAVNTPVFFNVPVSARFCRVDYLNGAAAQTLFDLQGALYTN